MDPKTSNEVSPQFSRVAFNDHAGKLWIVIILSLIYSAFTIMARVYIKYQMLGFDDLLFAFATVLHLAQSIALFVGLNSGLGKFNSITSQEQWATSSTSTIVAIILYLSALSFAKCSVLALILRIIGSKTGKSKTFCVGLLVLSVAWGISSCSAFLFNCRANALLTLDNVKQCPNQDARWAVITAIDVFTEILTWLFIVRLSWTLNMQFARKCQVVMAFSSRLLLIALSALRLAYFGKYPTSPQPQFAVTNSLLFQQAVIVWSLISATLPNMKSFLESFSIDMGSLPTMDVSGRESSGGYPLQSLGNGRSKATSFTAAAGAESSPSALFYSHSESGSHANHDSNSWQNLLEEGSSRAGSQEVIIKETA